MTVPTTMRGQPVRRPLTDTDVAGLRATLLEYRRARADQIEALLFLYDEAAAETGPVEAGELAVARSVLADIDAALLRLDDGSYGWCVRCREPIGADRLYSAPRALLCIECALER